MSNFCSHIFFYKTITKSNCNYWKTAQRSFVQVKNVDEIDTWWKFFGADRPKWFIFQHWKVTRTFAFDAWLMILDFKMIHAGQNWKAITIIKINVHLNEIKKSLLFNATRFCQMYFCNVLIFFWVKFSYNILIKKTTFQSRGHFQYFYENNMDDNI